jgi:branched-chain amino acid transport system permease protein
VNSRWLLPAGLLAGLALSFAVPHYGWVNKYQQMILMYVGINIILAASLNLVNGYMGEFSLGSAGFMAVGAYTASVVTVKLLPAALAGLGLPAAAQSAALSGWGFPAAVLAGGLAAALFGLVVAIPSFKTRGDYLALVTLAFLMIVKSLIENLDVIGGPRGFLGMKRLTTLPWVYAWTALTLLAIRNFVYSRFGRAVLAVREDETAAALMGVDTRRAKFLAFTVSAFFTGVAGGLFAHLLQFISPRVFDIIKSTDVLIMVYLGGIASLAGSVLGATLYTVLLEALRPSAVAWALGWLPASLFEPLNEHVLPHLNVWRMVIMPLLLVLVMLYRPRGIMGLREWRRLVPRRDREAADNPPPPPGDQGGRGESGRQA